MTSDDETLVRAAMDLADEAAAAGDAPFGAVLCDAAGAPVVRARNTQTTDRDPTAHAEINALRGGGALAASPRLDGWQIYVNAEPCSMCLSAIVKAGVTLLVYGAAHEPHLDPYLPAADVLARTRRPPQVRGGVLADEAAARIAAARATTDRVD